MAALKLALRVAFVLLCYTAYVSGMMGKDRVYYIAAVEVMWDYAPSGHNLVDGRKGAARMFIKNGKDRIGSRYKKCLYKQYTDDSYMDEIEQPGWLGLVGPVLRAEKGDRFVIHFKNKCKRQFSMHPHGVHYLKGSEGALYIDGTWGKLKQDDMVPPNGSHTYIWSIPENFAPLDSDPNCMTWAYHSHINPARDTNSGLIGALLTCKKGILNDDNTRKDVKYDFVMLYKIYDESLSWYIDENLEKCKDPKLCKELLSSNDPGFATSNMMHGINGRLFGNLPAFEACENEHVVWNMIGMGTEIDLHTAHINGQTFTVNDHRIDTVHLFAADFMTGDMYPKNPGRWLIQCAVNDHYSDGMQAFLDVKSCSQERAYAPPTWTAAHKTRTYYITAEEVWWRYAPSVWNKFSGGSLSDPSSRSSTYFGKSMTRIGGQYKKALFFEYTDETFTRRKYRSDSEIHLGFLGPVIRAEVGESIKVVFKNYASRNYSMHPHGAMYDKANEGASYNDSSKAIKDNAVPPGGMYTYTWYIPESFGPTYSDPDCLTNFYQSAVDPVRDTSSGLVGPLLTCKKGTLDHEGRQKGADKEFILVVQVTNENLSWYIDENIKKRIKDMSKVNKTDPAFVESNRMRNINGRSYGNLEGLEMCVGDKVSWHLIGLGTQTDIHPVHFFGNTLSKINRVDVFAVFPSTTQTLAMVPDNPGIWGLISRTNEHFKNGLTALYTVHGCGMKAPTKVPYDAKSRRYYVGAVEVEWEYAPLKRDVVKGKSLKRPDSVGYIFVRHDKGFIGSKYYKAVYREFTDASFTEPKKRDERNIHRGILGPALRAEVGEVIEVVFKNMASRPYSIHPHGVFYSKNNEGAPYLDHTGKHTDDMVTKNGFYVYRWLVPDRAGPGKSDPNCISWPYYSSVNPVKDVYAGLVGNIIICRKGILSKDGKRKDHIDREITLFFFLFDEMMSWYINKTTSKYAPSRMHDMSNSTFMASNIMNSINGFIYGNNQGLVMYKGEKIAWYIFALGGTMDMHTVHFHGQVLIHKRGNPTIVDVLAIFPGTTETLELEATNPGTWLLHCHVNDHLTNGMETFYTIKDSSAGGAWTTRRTTMDWRGTDSRSREHGTREIDYSDSRGMDSESMEDGGDDMWGKMDMIILIVACVVAAVVLGAAIIIPARGPPKASRTTTSLESGDDASETSPSPVNVVSEEVH